MWPMNENGPDDLPSEESIPEGIEPKIAPPELEYRVDTLNGEQYQSPSLRGFVFIPVSVELSAICDERPQTIRYADIQIHSPLNPEGPIRGKEIIPNLIKQMEAVKRQILRRKPGSGNELEFRTRDSEDMWEIKFVVESDELSTGHTTYKQYRHIKSGRVFVAKLTSGGQLFLPKMPKEWVNYSLACN